MYSAMSIYHSSEHNGINEFRTSYQEEERYFSRKDEMTKDSSGNATTRRHII